MLSDHGSDQRFLRAHTPEYSVKLWQAYLLSSRIIMELPPCYCCHDRIINLRQREDLEESQDERSKAKVRI